MIIECESEQEVMSTFPVMQQLRPHLDALKYFDLIEQFKAREGYRLIAYMKNDCVAGVTGFRPERSLFTNGEWVMYVDDLVTDEEYRSQGIGKDMLDWLKNECKRLKYSGIALDSGTQRKEAHDFYYREGMESTALHFFGPTEKR